MTNLMPEAGTPAGAPSGGPAPLAGGGVTTKERSQLQMVLGRFIRHRLAMGGLVVLLLLIAFAFLGPLIWEWDHRVNREIRSNLPPSATHPFGTTAAGQDMMAMVMRGAQQSLKVAFTVGLIVLVISALWGAIAGLFRGWVDAIMMRFVDVILVIPPLALVAAVAGNVRGGTTWFPIALILGFFGWPLYSRVVRGVVLSLREQEFIEAARAMGASDARIVFRHLLPNLTAPIIVSATIVMAVAVLAEAGLSFLGLGIQAPDTSLGQQVNNALTAMSTRPWLFYPPGILVLILGLTINFIGDGLRDALDPRQTMVRR